MMVLAKGLQAAGIASVMIGLVQGIQSESMWMELYLSIIGIVLFLIGRGVEKRYMRKHHPPPADAGSPPGNPASH